MKVQVARNGATVRAREIFDMPHVRGSRLGGAPGRRARRSGAGDELGLRVTSYCRADPDDSRSAQPAADRRGVAAAGRRGDVPGARARSGRQEGRRRARQPLGDTAVTRCRSRRTCPLPPGQLHRSRRDHGRRRTCRIGRSSRRSAAVPRSGDRRRPARCSFACRARPVPKPASPRHVSGRTSGSRSKWISKVTKDPGPAARTSTFEIASTADGPALLHAPATSPGLARGLDARAGRRRHACPAARRVRRPRQGDVRWRSLGEVRRAFTVVETAHEAAGGATAGDGRGRRRRPSLRASALRIAPPADRAAQFALDQVLAPPVLGTVPRSRRGAAGCGSRRRCAVCSNAPARRASSASSCRTRRSTAAPVAAFLKGLTLLSEQKLEPAAAAFRDGDARLGRLLPGDGLSRRVLRGRRQGQGSGRRVAHRADQRR